MFVGRQELEKVKTELEAVKDDTALLNERFVTHTKQEAATAATADKKMDEIIGLVKENHSRIEITADRVHADLAERLSREYATTAAIDEKISNMKNCCRAEFANISTAELKHKELEKDIRGVRDLALDKVINVRRESYIVISVMTTIAILYASFFKETIGILQ